MKKIFCFLLSIPVFTYAFSQANPTSGDIFLGLRKLNTLGTVLYVAAHPDDENTRLITYLAKDRLFRTGYLSLTRGDGGQNLIGDEQGIELGLIRTQELLSARRIDGGEQFFTRAFDFGYSKTPSETFLKWDREKVLSDVVWVIRKFKPDVIITRFPSTGEGGHGHHTASAILANEAFVAAADPARFPEQLKLVQPWQVKRVVWNVFGGSNSNSDLGIDVGGYNPVLGKSYGEIAAESRSQHKSQGFGVPAGRGEAIEYFNITSGTKPSNDLFSDIDVSWNRVAGSGQVASMIDGLIRSFNFLHPELSVKPLVNLYRAINEMPDHAYKQQKLSEVVKLIEACSGLYLDIFTGESFVAQGDSVRLQVAMNNRLGVNAILKKVQLEGFDSTLNATLAKNKNLAFSKTFFVPYSKEVTQPYWLANKMSEGYYNVADQQLIGLPDVQPAYTMDFFLNIEGEDLVIRRTLRQKFTDPVKGEVYQPFVVTPPVVIRPEPSLVLLKEKQMNPVELTIRANRDISLEDPKLVSSLPPKGYRHGAYSGPLRRNQETTVTTGINGIIKDSMVTFYVGHPSRPYASMQNRITYPHIPQITYFTPAAVKIVAPDLKTYGKKIGYIVGAGDKVADALEQMGYEVTLLTDKELARNNLQQFDAIISGVRAYNTNEWMNRHYERLMKYVENGGNLIVQYNTSNNIGPVRAKIGPYPFNINRNRITDENAEVKFLKPAHPALNFPNKITQDDFKGWIQERSIYHAANLDSNFQTVIGMRDPGESEDANSLVIAKYGKGYFTYTGLVFFRELPAGVPGAYRLLANLIALNRKRDF
jgi:LmbE family N-acetylglucosaminyl deacetylase